MILLIFCPSFLGLFSVKANSWVSGILLMLLLKLLKRESLAIRIRFWVEKNKHRWKKSCFIQKNCGAERIVLIFGIPYLHRCGLF